MQHLHICISVQKADDGQRVKLILVVLGNPGRFLQVNRWMHSLCQFKWFLSGDLFIPPNPICTHSYWKTNLHIHQLTLNKKRKMKIMGRVAWLILSVVVSVCVVFCILCCLQNNPVFLSVTIISYFEKWKLWAMYFGEFLRRSNYNRKNYDRKKGKVVWPSVGINLR